MEDNAFSINELPFEILMEIFEYFSIPEIARFPMTCTHWRDLMQQDHFWASLARKTYGQYVGETPTKRQLLELSEGCGQELTFMHWLQYRSLFGLTMNMAVHVGVSMPDDVFDYKVTLEPGLNSAKQGKTGYYFGGFNAASIDHDGVRSLTWNSTFYLVITPEEGAPIRREIPLISLADVSTHGQIRQRGKVYKYKLKLTKLVGASSFLSYYHHEFNSPLDVLKDATSILPDQKMKMARVGFKAHLFKEVFRYENPFLYPPTSIIQNYYNYGNNCNFCYQDLIVHEYIPIITKNFGTIQSQMQHYLAEIVCGFELLHNSSFRLMDSIPVIKKDGHLQFIYAGPRNPQTYSYFGRAPETVANTNNNHDSCTPFQTDVYALGVFMLEVCSGELLDIRVNQVTVARVPLGLPVELRMLLSSLLTTNGKERPNNVTVIKKDPYFKGIDWQKMRKQQWSPKFLPNLE